MTVRLGVEPIKTPQLNVAALQARMDKEMGLVGQEIKAQFNETTATWQGPKPTFNIWFSHEKGLSRVTVYPAGSALGVKKWRWLDEGTKVRHAVMSQDWISKTMHARGGLANNFMSFGGRGKLVFVSKKIKRPGIKARKWSEQMTKAYATRFGDRINNAVRAWATAGAWQSW